MLARLSVAALRKAASRQFSASAAASGKVAFIGLGNMGGFMAKNLLKAGHELSVFDLSEAAIKSAEEAGASRAVSAVEAANGADTVITMLPSSPHVQDVYENGVIDASADNALLIDCSTIDPTVTVAVAEKAAAKGRRMVDAPVSGGVGGAEAGTLTFMVGGSEPDFEAARPVLEAMGKNIVHCGAPGTGQTAKICNNLVLGISMGAVAEAMNLGVQLGIDPKTLAGIINTSSGRCWSSDTYNPCPGVMEGVPASRGYTGGFGAALMRKDLGLAIQAAEAVKAPLTSGKTAHALYDDAVNSGFDGKDFSSLYQLFHDRSGK